MAKITVEGASINDIMEALQLTPLPQSAPKSAPKESIKEETPSKKESAKRTEKAPAEASKLVEASKPAEPTAPTTAMTGVSFAMIADIVPKLVNVLGKPKTVEMLQKYGVKKAGELKEDQYAGFLADATVALT